MPIVFVALSIVLYRKLLTFLCPYHRNSMCVVGNSICARVRHRLPELRIFFVDRCSW